MIQREKNGFDHINRNAPVLIRTPKLTRFEPGNSVVLNPLFSQRDHKKELEAANLIEEVKI